MSKEVNQEYGADQIQILEGLEAGHIVWAGEHDSSSALLFWSGCTGKTGTVPSVMFLHPRTNDTMDKRVTS